MSSIPVILCGKSPTLAKSFKSALDAKTPHVDVVHVIHDVETGSRELPGLLRGEPVGSSSGLGSNTDPDPKRQHRVPRAVVVGKGYDEEEIEQLRAMPDAQKVPWLLPDDKEMTWTRIATVAVSAGTALPGIVADRVIACLEKNDMLKESGNGENKAGKVFWF